MEQNEDVILTQEDHVGPQPKGPKKKSKVPQATQQLAREMSLQKPPTEAKISGREMIERGYISVKVPGQIPAKPGLSTLSRAVFPRDQGSDLGANEGTNYSQFNSLGAQRASVSNDPAKGFEGQPSISERKAYKQLENSTELIVDVVTVPQAEERTRSKDSLTPRETKADPNQI